MNDKYTPTEDVIWEAYEYWSAGSGGAERAELDRFINRVKADALREASEEIQLLILGYEPGGNLDDLATVAASGWLSGRAERLRQEDV